MPAIAGVLELLADTDAGAVAGGTRRNRAHAEEFAVFADGVEEARRWLVCDAMTSGGLLAAVPAEAAAEMPGALIGRLVAGEPGTIRVAGPAEARRAAARTRRRPRSRRPPGSSSRR